MSSIYTEENGFYCIDCTNAVWSTDALHSIYSNIGNVLNDADFIIENKDNILIVEYKNALVPGASNPGSFNPNTKLDNYGRKFYDSLHYLTLIGKNKPKIYICVLEYKNGDSTSRKMFRNKLKERLPFKLKELIRKDNIRLKMSKKQK